MTADQLRHVWCALLGLSDHAIWLGMLACPPVCEDVERMVLVAVLEGARWD